MEIEVDICEGYDVDDVTDQRTRITVYWNSGRIERVRVENSELSKFLDDLRRDWLSV